MLPESLPQGDPFIPVIQPPFPVQMQFPAPAPFFNNNYQPNFAPSFKPTPNRIFVGGLDDKINESVLKAAFAKYGEILNTKVVRYENATRGFGFVTFKNVESAQKVLDEAKGNKTIAYKNRRFQVAPAQRRQHFFQGNTPSGDQSGGMVVYQPCVFPELGYVTYQPVFYPHMQPQQQQPAVALNNNNNTPPSEPPHNFAGSTQLSSPQSQPVEGYNLDAEEYPPLPTTNSSFTTSASATSPTSSIHPSSSS